EDRLDILAGVARQRDLEIVNCGGAIHREGRGIPAAHEVDQDWRESAFDYVPTQPPDNFPAFVARGCHGADYRTEGITGEHPRQAVEQPRNTRALAVWGSEIGDFHLPTAFLQTDGLQTGQVDRPLGIPAHAAAPVRSTLRRASAV